MVIFSSSSTAYRQACESTKKWHKVQSSKNCPAEAPEGDSIQDLSALCNAADPE
jgi:hypothetical protein